MKVVLICYFYQNSKQYYFLAGFGCLTVKVCFREIDWKNDIKKVK